MSAFVAKAENQGQVAAFEVGQVVVVNSWNKAGKVTDAFRLSPDDALTLAQQLREAAGVAKENERLAGFDA